jgi:anti-anti-sigma factor
MRILGILLNYYIIKGKVLIDKELRLSNMLPVVKVLKPSGIIDENKINELRQEIKELVEQTINWILIDFKKVTFMDSAGLGGLVLILKTVRSAEGRLFIMEINEQIKMLFELTNMDQVFEIVSSKKELGEKLAQETLDFIEVN